MKIDFEEILRMNLWQILGYLLINYWHIPLIILGIIIFVWIAFF